MMKLYIEDDSGNIKILPFESAVVSVGRAPDNDVVLGERNVSRHHLKIVEKDGAYQLAPVAARYGFKVNGKRADGDNTVRPGEVVEVGDYKMKILSPDQALPDAETTARSAVKVDEVVTPVPDPKRIEEVARQGWTTDFDADDAAVVRRGSNGKFVVLGILVLLAVGLGVVYALTTSAPETREGTLIGAMDRTLAPPPGQPASAVIEAPPAVEPARPNVPATPATDAATTEAILLGTVRATIQQGNLAEAEGLLKTCSSPACRQELKRIADAHNGLGNPAKAKEIYQRLYRSATDAAEKAKLQQSIGRIGAKAATP